ncbi:MAG: PEP-utilizing enzyme, partial [Syntrophales bacterium]|nr:PEP-utilizing enzyme [Syntrophales bacterium]
MEQKEDKQTLVLKGIGVSPGVVTGKAYVFDRLDAQIAFYKLSRSVQIAAEVRRLRAAIRMAEAQLRELKRHLGEVEGVKPLYIIDVHLMLLRDRSFINSMVQQIRDLGINAEWSVRLVVDKYREIFEKMDNEYLRERFNDVRYAGQMILRNLAGGERGGIPSMGENVIVIAVDLSPADTAQIKIDKVLGFATDIGSRTSHTAIVARSMEIPAVVGLERITRVVRTNDEIILDGSAGLVIVNPDPEVLRRYEDKKRQYQDCLLYTS